MNTMMHEYFFNPRLRPGPDRSWEKPAQIVNPVEPKAKGVCRHCDKKIGRGLYFHEKACAKK